jgi:flavin-dependent dehydrogenase
MLIKEIQGSYDLAVVGAGILGLAHASHAAKKGLRVIVSSDHSKPEELRRGTSD